MYQAHNWWFPDEDDHFDMVMKINIKKYGTPEYQKIARDLSIAQVKNKRVALDIGANVGLWTRDLTENFEKVIAFEPIPRFIDCLLKNVPADNLEIRQHALGDEDSVVDMVITKGNTGHTHVDQSSYGKGSTDIKRLDSITDLPAFQYMKIDCEGYEILILNGAKETILKNKPVMVVEQKGHKVAKKGLKSLEKLERDKKNRDAVNLLKSWGARELDHFKSDIILGW